ncbi:hypothetical protein [Nocardioides sp. Soil805]|uniref:hypothetical protein n=1 Tax=Nocardioides sp. Soil805 TaxID=1736416 RepID=UPI0007039A45|nr:hypothetical protein [Nocardioides sp. Soil805]KRF34096.1 hypothetical protein ASG94_15250 [Nocardioides sp. Soil805]
MATLPPDPALADPMLRELRERHPDVDIVMLPPVRPLDAPAATAAQCRSRMQHADRVLTTLGERLDREPTARADYWWGQDHPEVRRWVTAAAFGDLGDEGGVPLLRRLANTLVHLGWEPRPAADGSPRVRGVAGPFELVASASDDSVSVTITSDALHVPADLHAELHAEIGAGQESDA